MSGAALRVLVVTTSYPAGPDDTAGTFVQTGARALAELGMQVTVLHPARRASAPTEDEPGIRRVTLPRSKGRSPLLDRGGMPEALERSPIRAGLAAGRLALRLRREATRLAGSHDAIVSHWLLPSGWAGAAAARRAAVRHVAVLHSADVHLLQRLPGRGALVAKIAASTDHFAAVSESVRVRFLEALPAALRRRIEARTSVRANPIPQDAYRAARGVEGPAGRPVVLYLGRLEPVKGVDLLMQALRAGDPWDVVVAGEGSLRRSLEEQSRVAGLPVSFLGNVTGDAKWDLLGRASVVVAPSRALRSGRTEGLPVCIQESLACGTPVVAASVGGIPEVVRPGITGRLVPPEDPVALRQAIERVVLTHEPGRARACREAAEAFRADDWAEWMSRLLTSTAEAAL